MSCEVAKEREQLFSRHRKILPIARDIIALDHLDEISIVDIGCYNRPVYGAVKNLKPSVSYVGVDEDKAALEYLRSEGLTGQTFSEFLAGGEFDYSFGLEVLEHIRFAESQEFLSALCEKTKKAIFLTMPNFEGWDGADNSTLRRRQEYSEVRYIPDHLNYFDARSSDPHRHKQITTVEKLSEQFMTTFSESDWDWEIVKAWPWRLIDESVPREFTHYFKLFVIAWRKCEFPSDLRQSVEWLSH